MFDCFALANFDDELAGTRAKSITFDAIFWLEQVRTAVIPTRTTENRELPLPVPSRFRRTT